MTLPAVPAAPLSPLLSPLVAVSSAGACVLAAAPDGSLTARRHLGMTLRSALHRLFGIGKTEADCRRNRQSWEWLITTVKRRAGEAVGELVCRTPIRLPGDGRKALTAQQRMERGTYLSGAALQQVQAAFARGCSLSQCAGEAMAALLDEPLDEHALGPLSTLLARLSDPGDQTSTTAEYPQTQCFVARQLKMGLRPEDQFGSAAVTLGAVRRALLAALPDGRMLDDPAWRAQVLAKLDAGILHDGPASCPRSPDALAALQRAADLALRLSAWRRIELRQQLANNQRSIVCCWVDAPLGAGHDPDGAALPADQHDATPASQSSSSPPLLQRLLQQRGPLLDQLWRRERLDSVWRCDLDAVGDGSRPQLDRIAQRRRRLLARASAGPLEMERQRDQVRLGQCQALCRWLRRETARHTANGVAVDLPRLIAMAEGVLTDPRYVQPFIAARNLEYLQDIGRGRDRAFVIADLVRTCDMVITTPEQRGDLDSADFEWLADALDRGEHHAAVVGANLALKGAEPTFARFRERRVPVAAVCDAVAGALAGFVERREQLRQTRRDSSASQEERWKASVEALRDIVRTRELTPPEIAPIVFPAIRPYLQTRHHVMAEMRQAWRQADQTLSLHRTLLPALQGWTQDFGDGPIAATLVDLASLRITTPLVSAQNLFLAAEQDSLHGGDGRLPSDLRTLEAELEELLHDTSQSHWLRKTMRNRAALLSHLEGDDEHQGVLVLACAALNRYVDMCRRRGVSEPAEPPLLLRNSADLYDAQQLREQAQAAHDAVLRLTVDQINGPAISQLSKHSQQRIQAELLVAQAGIESLRLSLDHVLRTLDTVIAGQCRGTAAQAIIPSSSAIQRAEAAVTPYLRLARAGLRALGVQLMALIFGRDPLHFARNPRTRPFDLWN